MEYSQTHFRLQLKPISTHIKFDSRVFCEILLGVKMKIGLHDIKSIYSESAKKYGKITHTDLTFSQICVGVFFNFVHSQKNLLLIKDLALKMFVKAKLLRK